MTVRPYTAPPEDSERRLGAIFRAAAFGGIGVVLAAGGAEILMRGRLNTSLSSFGTLGPELAALEPRAFMTLGFLIVMLGPAFGLSSLLASYARQRDWRAAGIALLVIAFIFIGIPLKSCMGGGA